MLWKIEVKRRREWQRMRWLDNIIDSMDMNLSKLWEIVKGREAWHATVHGVTRSQTRLSDCTTTGDSLRSSPGSGGSQYSHFGYLHLWLSFLWSFLSCFSVAFVLKLASDFSGFPVGSICKEPTCSAGNPGSIPGCGRCSGEGNGNPLQHSCLENSMDRGA